MEQFILKLNLSNKLSNASSESRYVLMISPNEFSLICEVQQWIQIMFRLHQDIALKYDDCLIPDNESVMILPLIGSAIEVVPREKNELRMAEILRKDSTWHGIAVYSSVRKKLDKISPENKTIWMNDDPMNAAVPITTNVKTPPRTVAVAQSNTDSNSGEVLKSPKQPKPFSKKSFNIGAFLTNLRNEEPYPEGNDSVAETSWVASNDPDESITISVEKQKRKRVRKRKKRSPQDVEDTVVPSKNIFTEMRSPSHADVKHIRFSENVGEAAAAENGQNDTERDSDAFMTPLVKTMTGIPPLFVLQESTKFIQTNECE